MEARTSSNGVPRRPPPDYTQQSVKLRLFIGVAALILLLAIIERAFDAKTRNWFRAHNNPPASAKLNNQIPSAALRTALDPPGTIVAASDSKSDAEASEPGAAIQPVERAWRQGWKDVASRLPATDQSLLFELLHLALRREALSPEKTAAATTLVERIDRLWPDYQATAFQSLADLKGDDQALWIDVLRQIDDHYSQEARPALKAAAGAGELSEKQTETLLSLQKTLVSIAQAQIEDDTVVFRPAEREIWFHQLARAQDAANSASKQPPAPRVAYLQLHKQPAAHRGQWVTVAGTARLAYRVPAPSNYLGIKEYVVYWLHPAGGPDSPILIYALAAPAGFPPIGPQLANSKLAGQLREEIEVTGIFFKRCAYAAQGGDYTAPLLIAHTPRWRPAPPLAATAQAPFTTSQFTILAVVTFLLSMFITAILWNRTRSRRANA